jgi:hypothetical protein
MVSAGTAHGADIMAIAFSDVAAALGYVDRSYADYILQAAHLPPLSAAQGQALQGWMASASSPSGAKLTAAQIGRLVAVWAYNLGCSMPQIGIYASDNM